MLTAAKLFCALLCMQVGTPQTYVQLGPIVRVNVDGKYNGFPTVTKRHNGDLIVMYRGDVNRHVVTNSGDIIQQVSSDNGKSWSAPWKVFSAPNDHDFRAAGVLKLKARGQLLAVFTDAKASAGHSMNNVLRVAKSTNDGKTWRGLATIPYSKQATEYAIGATCKPIQLASGRIIVGAFTKHSGIDNRSIHLYCSDNGGSNWRHLSKVVNGEIVGRDIGESSLLQLSNGDLICFIRDSKANETLYARSTDDGDSWSVLQNGFSSSAAPRAALYGQKIFVFGRGKGPLRGQSWIYWCNETNMKKWYGPWIVQGNEDSSLQNYGDFVVDGDALFGIWAEQTSIGQSDLLFRQIGKRVGPNDVLLADGFDRNDSGSIGTTDGFEAGSSASGLAWAETGKGNTKILNRELVNIQPGKRRDGAVTLDTGVSNVDISTRMKPTGNISLLLRASADLSNRVQVTLSPANGQFSLEKVVSNRVMDLARADAGITRGNYNNVRVVANGPQYVVFLNGKAAFKTVDRDLTPNTIHGVFLSNSKEFPPAVDHWVMRATAPGSRSY